MGMQAVWQALLLISPLIPTCELNGAAMYLLSELTPLRTGSPSHQRHGCLGDVRAAEQFNSQTESVSLQSVFDNLSSIGKHCIASLT